MPKPYLDRAFPYALPQGQRRREADPAVPPPKAAGDEQEGQSLLFNLLINLIAKVLSRALRTSPACLLT